MNNSFKIANSIGMIDNDLIMEADEIVERKSVSGKPVYLRYAAAAAACLCVAGGAAVLAKNRTAPDAVISDGSTKPETPGVQSSITGNADPVASNMPIVKISGVYFNEASSPDVGGSRLYFDPEKYDTISWNKQDVLGYYGRELTPAYIPEELTPSSWNGGTSVIMEKDGKIVHDTVGLSFYHDYYEDGSPKLTENVAATKGFSIEASKLGIPFNCGCFSGLEDTQATDIGGTEVLFGHYLMPYGPFDPETHVPSGYYDIYVAELELEGISYRVTTKQLEAGEIVKIVSSIIYGESVSVEE